MVLVDLCTRDLPFSFFKLSLSTGLNGGVSRFDSFSFRFIRRAKTE